MYKKRVPTWQIREEAREYCSIDCFFCNARYDLPTTIEHAKDLATKKGWQLRRKGQMCPHCQYLSKIPSHLR